MLEFVIDSLLHVFRYSRAHPQGTNRVPLFREIFHYTSEAEFIICFNKR